MRPVQLQPLGADQRDVGRRDLVVEQVLQHDARPGCRAPGGALRAAPPSAGRTRGRARALRSRTSPRAPGSPAPCRTRSRRAPSRRGGAQPRCPSPAPATRSASSRIGGCVRLDHVGRSECVLRPRIGRRRAHRNSRSRAPVGSTSSRRIRSSSSVGSGGHGDRRRPGDGSSKPVASITCSGVTPGWRLRICIRFDSGWKSNTQRFVTQSCGPPGRPRPLAVVAAVAPADSGAEVEPLDERARVVRRRPEVDQRDHAAEVGHPAAARQAHLRRLVRPDHRVVDVAVGVHLGAAEGEGVVAAVLRVRPEVVGRVRRASRRPSQRPSESVDSGIDFGSASIAIELAAQTRSGACVRRASR